MKRRKWMAELPVKILLGFLAMLILLPIFWLVFSGFKLEKDIISWPPTFFPKTVTMSNWHTVKARIDIVAYTVNSLVYAFGTSIPAVLVNALAGYAFSRLQFKFKNVLFLLFLATMMIPFQVIMIPLYVEVHYLGWLNSYAGLIIPKIASAQWIFLARASFDCPWRDSSIKSR